ncbi:MAG: hypothetical protein LRY53_00145 [Burkholderiaceae bacterium]|nr:hypothetical protein [Burkholderiaceae bacterium]
MAQSPDRIDQTADRARRRNRHQIRHSSLYRHIIAEPLGEEMDSWKLFLRREWHWLLLAVLGVVVLVAWVKPLPPSEVSLAVGAENSALARLGERYVSPFEEAGIELKLVYTEPLDAADESDKAVDAAFVVGGLFDAKSVPQMVSLGSIEYAPLWVFHRGEVPAGADVFDAFVNQGLKIGLAGPASRAILGQMAQLRGFDLDVDAGFDPVSNRQVVDRFLAGKLDVVAIVDGYDSHHVSRLIQADGVSVFNMRYAQAYQRHIPFLELVSVPQGSLSLTALKPDTDITLVASTVSLLVNKDLHPAAQQLFLTATTDIEGLTEPFFARPGVFPAYLDPEVPLSAVAKRFYAEGGLPLSERLPYWLASLVDRLWLLVLGLLAVVYPLLRLVPRYRVIRSEMQVSDAYRVLRAIDASCSQTQNLDELIQLRDDLNLLEEHLQQFWISSESMRWYYTLRNTLNQLRSRLDVRIADAQKMQQQESHM